MTAPVELIKAVPGVSSLAPDEEPAGIKFKDWGFKIDRLFEVAYRFYKRNESKAFHPTFDERNQLNALILQARYGNYDDSKSPDIGVLDLVGKNRRHRWSMLKGLSKMEAKSEFICTLDKICPLFKAYAEAVKLSSCAQLNTKLDEGGRPRSDSEVKRLDGSESKEQLNAIRNSLQKQTYSQFKIYAEKQYPNDLPKQRYLITTLQEQYYQQYISQMHSELNISSHGNSDENKKPLPSPSTSLSSQPSETINCDGTSVAIDEPVQSCQLSHSIKMDNVNDVSIEQLETERQEKLPELSDISLQERSEAIVTENYKVSQEPSGDALESSSNVDYGKVPDVSGVHKNETDTSCETNHINDKVHNYGDNRARANQADFDKKTIGVFEPYPEPKLIQNKVEKSNFHCNATIDFTKSIRNYKQETSKLDLPQHTEHQYLLQPADSVIASQDFYSNILPPSAAEQNTSQTEILQNNTTLESTAVTSSQDTFNLSQQQKVQLLHSELSSQLSHGQADSLPCESSSGTSSPLEQSVTYESLEPATIWTKKGVHEFKDSLIDDKHGGAYVVKQGTLLTIQVPTYPDGKYIYWEFATEDYDIGFGLDFVYDNSLPTPLALKIYEDSDEDDDEEEEEEEEREDNNDLTTECQSAPDSAEEVNGSLGRKRKQAEKIQKIANTVSIVPTYRRDSHEEVFVGRHRYPGRGYYLLKFDNTYSVLRSKSMFFRICYFI